MLTPSEKNLQNIIYTTNSMKTVFFTILSVFLFTGYSFAQAQQSKSDSLYLNIIIPEEDYVTYSYSRYRVAANTHPNAVAYINGNEAKVYRNGAFIDVIAHDSDTTAIEFRVEMNGKSLSDTLYLVQPIPVKPNFDENIITDMRVQPSSDLWLESGEVLQVQFLGKPGQDAVFNIDGFIRNIPMTEIPNGEGSLYKGEYKVQPNDNIRDRKITFKMKKGLFGYHKRTSEHSVSFLKKPLVGEVISESAYLNIGMGTDRLGGAKYGTIAQGVMLNIVGKKSDNYKVRLSQSLEAWIPANFVELKDEWAQPAQSLTGNIRIAGQGDKDVITLSLSEKLPYISYQEIDPNKIIVDVFGATSNTNWKIKHLTSSGIKDVDWKQVENDRYRLIIELEHSQNWGYSVGYGWGSQMKIEVRRPPIITSVMNPLAGRTIAVDAGHGGSNKGSLGAAGNLEKDVTLQISKIIEGKLQDKGVNVVMLRTNDDYVYMSDRRDLTIESKADVLVSIHTNSIGYGSDPRDIYGTGSFYKHIAFKPLAAIMYNNMTALGLKDYGLTGSFNFSLNAPIEFPNVLVETAFISNPEEELLLTDEEFQHKIADAVISGLEQFYLENAFIETVSDMPDK